mgnify:CR=1 FL=1
MELLKSDLKNVVVMLLGFLVMSLGITLIMDSQLGLFPWGVLHQGISTVIPLTFGQVTSYLGFIVLFFSVLFFKTNIGPGTILNILMVGPMIDLFDLMVNLPNDGYVFKTIFFVVGLILMSIGKALYISAKLGAGPRDGLFVGVSRVFKVEVKYVKPIIEVIVLASGYLLGGLVGIGTIITMFMSGYLVQTFFKLFKFESRSDRQRNILDYFRQKKSA